MKLSKELGAISVGPEYFRIIGIDQKIKSYIGKLFESHIIREILSYWEKKYHDWFYKNLGNILILDEGISIGGIVWDLSDLKISNEGVTYFNYNGAVNAAKSLGKYLPTETTFRYSISLMPGESFEEKSFNFFLLTGIGPFGYLVNNSFEGISGAYYWTSTCDTQNFHKVFQLNFKTKKVLFESRSGFYNLPVRLVSQNFQSKNPQ